MKASKVDQYMASSVRKESFFLNQGYRSLTWNSTTQSKYIVNYICWSYVFKVRGDGFMSGSNDRYVREIYEGV